MSKQWGALFQRLLREQREHAQEARKMFTISEQIEDIKTAIISTIGNTQSREVARGLIKYRRLSDFLSGLNLPDFSVVTDASGTFEELLGRVGIVKVKDIPGSRATFGRSALIKSDGTFYELRFAQEFLARIAVDWTSFITLAPEVRQIIFEAISDMGHMGPSVLRYRGEQFDEYFAEQLEKEGAKEMPIEDLLKGQPTEEPRS